MKRKSIYITLGIALILSMPYACKDSFLNTLPPAVASDVLLANEKGVNLVLIGAYSAIQGKVLIDNETSWGGAVSNWVWGDVMSDDATKGSSRGDQGYLLALENYTANATNDYTRFKWFCNYAGIGRTNDVLRVMAKCNPALSDATQTSIKAQVCFIRAFMHFELKRVFNNIPYITEADDAKKVPNNIDAWPLIEKDLKYAVDNLPVTQADVGRPTKYAAEAVLARVYMFQKKWDLAKVLLDEIIGTGKFSLMPNFGDNFVPQKRNNHESVFEIQYNVNDGSYGSQNAGYGDDLCFPIETDGKGTCCGFKNPTQNLVNAFQVDANGLPLLNSPVPNFKHDQGILSSQLFVQDTITPVDPRLDLTVGRRGVPYLDWGIHRGYSWIRSQVDAGPYDNKKTMFWKKDKGIESTTTGWAIGVNTNNYRPYRYGHILLWRAECAVESASPDFGYATTLVNMIRNRAANQIVLGRCRTFVLNSQEGLKVDYSVPAANYLVKPYPVFSSLDYARKAIRTETRLEFAMEGMRHFDLVRWGIAEPVMNAYLEQDRGVRDYFGGTIPSRFIANKNEYCPIPQGQIDLQPGVLSQNPGY